MKNPVCDTALRYINLVFVDGNSSKKECRDNLNALKDEIEIMIDSLSDVEEEK